MLNCNKLTRIYFSPSFFYDSNSLWNNYVPANFCIIIINNGGGNIFRIIPGPDKTKALNQFFSTEHKRKASGFASMYGFDYALVNNAMGLKTELNSLFNKQEKPKIIEVDTSEIENHKILKSYFKSLK